MEFAIYMPKNFAPIKNNHTKPLGFHF